MPAESYLTAHRVPVVPLHLLTSPMVLVSGRVFLTIKEQEVIWKNAQDLYWIHQKRECDPITMPLLLSISLHYVCKGKEFSEDIQRNFIIYVSNHNYIKEMTIIPCISLQYVFQKLKYRQNLVHILNLQKQLFCFLEYEKWLIMAGIKSLLSDALSYGFKPF